jgi:hypothetical protein
MKCPKHKKEMVVVPTKFGPKWVCDGGGTQDCDYVSWAAHRKPQPAYVRAVRHELIELIKSLGQNQRRVNELAKRVAIELGIPKPRFATSLAEMITEDRDEVALLELMGKVSWIADDQAWANFSESKQDAPIKKLTSFYEQNKGCVAVANADKTKWNFLEWRVRAADDLCYIVHQEIRTEEGAYRECTVKEITRNHLHERDRITRRLEALIDPAKAIAETEPGFPAWYKQYHCYVPWRQKSTGIYAAESGMFVKVGKWHPSSQGAHLDLGVFFRGQLIAKDAFVFPNYWNEVSEIDGFVCETCYSYEASHKWIEVRSQDLGQYKSLRWEAGPESMQSLFKAPQPQAKAGERKFDLD